ncbi:type II toxin-antitoxin system HicB family antitoxin [Spirosoma sp. KCTC 42546]|uniref:type II toxin-antitoxin system HicB family antitoxin n=1 Tax=Spirosoma sp. KCTC 42546 TaxID=2520506 RepID=UPI001AEFFDEF|nr:type II toxin-antitoxin system HicB family antitoxin [Spirosoma sp. KCTC 42546]
MMQYVVIIEETEEGGYSAYVPDLPVCFTVGDTLDEVKTNIKSAIELYLEEIREMGMVLPLPKTISTLVAIQAA